MKCLLLLSLFGLSFSAAAEEASWVAVNAGEAASGLRVTGHVIPEDGALHVESARVQGRVTSILRREGEKVSPGTPLLSISSAECLSLREEQRVAQQRGLPELIDAVGKREKQLGLSFNGDDCLLLAQNSGTLTKRNVENGSAFNVGDNIVTILETGRLSVELELPEQAVAKVKPGQIVSLELPSEPGKTLKTRVEAVVPTVDPTNRTLKVRVRKVSLPKSATLDSLVFGQIDTGSREQILQVPTTAIVFDSNKNWVVKQSKPEPQKVGVVIVNETASVSSIRPVNTDELKQGDKVAGTGAIFYFKR